VTVCIGFDPIQFSSVKLVVMNLTVLGSGTGVLNPKRGSSGYWLETEGRSLLLDCSASAIWRMAEYDLNWPDLDAIWISHFHLDHVGGLAPFLAGTKHAEAMTKRTNPLRVFGPKGTRGLFDSFNAVNNYKLFQQPFSLEIIEVEPLKDFEIVPGVKAVALSTPHTPESLAIHLREMDETLVYTADTGFTETLSAFAKGVDLLLMECSYLRDKPVEKHLELPEAIHIIRRSAPKRAVLTHFYPFWEDVDFDAEVKKIDSRNKILQAFDGLRLDISEIANS
jgi:ribonuclease BN (tRNA processing enzyme)